MSNHRRRVDVLERQTQITTADHEPLTGDEIIAGALALVDAAASNPGDDDLQRRAAVVRCIFERVRARVQGGNDEQPTAAG